VIQCLRHPFEHGWLLARHLEHCQQWAVLNRRKGNRLRTVADLYPVDTDLEEDSATNCSAERPSRGKHQFVNTTLANQSLSLLAHPNDRCQTIKTSICAPRHSK
jgi:hypothetical protein